MRLIGILIFIVVVLFSTGCELILPSTATVPTLQPTAAAIATVEIVAGLEISDAVVVSDDTASTPTAVRPTAAPTATPTPVINQDINLTSPQVNTTVQLGGPIIVSGLGSAYPGHSIEVAVISLDDQLITAALTELSVVNTWQIELMLPTIIAGQARIVANLFSEDGTFLASDSTTIFLAGTTNDERYLLLDRPGYNTTTAVAGYSLFFDGVAEQPTDFLVQIALKNGPNCQSEVSLQNYTMRGSGYWQAFFRVPETATGAACAIVFFGDVGTSGRREVQLPIDILPRTDPGAYGILLAYPPNNSNARPGQRISLYGTAYNAPDDQFTITLTLPDGTLAASEVVQVERNGYWEHTLLLPLGIAGEVLLAAELRAAETVLAGQTIFLNIVPEGEEP